MVSRERVFGQRELNGTGLSAPLCAHQATLLFASQPRAGLTEILHVRFTNAGLWFGAQQEASTAMPKRIRWSVHVVLTVISFATSGRAPRLPEVGPRDQQAIEERLAIVMDE